ncbi:hypothetical protein PPYR_03985 [Photinus pyralis]|uniref:Single domain-containing protein n=1 Tax=Photinus pyralis TaxID=7054 RepID=A0A5N4AWU0_PHOPY|nr:uncharacterized protein LOC116164898 [Photinus pyralis]XP_031335272.1 uncharacterized protein LOC116165113 [Photinus pyralis]KAB0801799.1 hypothetical protein PPYR_03985 [Photinus pyralis]
MKLLAILLFIFGICLMAHGWTSRAHVEMDPEDPEVCLYEKVGKFRVGESVSLHPNTCAEATCGHGIVTTHGCGVVDAKPPCIVRRENLSKPYPDCCPTINCPQN